MSLFKFQVYLHAVSPIQTSHIFEGLTGTSMAIARFRYPMAQLKTFVGQQYVLMQIGYDGVIKTGNPYGSRNLRSSRMGAKSINRGP